MGLSFVALDFETANSNRASACSLGMTKVIDGKFTDSKYEIFKPPAGFDYFDARNIAIHGIRPEDVLAKKRFIQIWPEFHSFIDGLPVIAHNASFDISVLRAALSSSEYLWPQLEYACSYVISKSKFDMARHRLSDVAKAANVIWDENQHHNALFDSRICAEIVLSLAAEQKSNSLQSFMNSLGLEIGRLFEDGWYTCRSTKISSISHHSSREKLHSLRDIAVNDEADPSHPLFGQVVVFTGAISISRPEAWELVAKIGAIPKDGLSRKTNYLVLGEQDLSKLKAGETKSTKQREAEAFRDSGLEIEIIDERDFFSLLEPQEWRVDKLMQSNFE